MKMILYSAVLVFLGMIIFSARIINGDDYSVGQSVFKRNCQFCHHRKGDDNYPSAYYMQYRPKDFSNPGSWKGVDEQKIANVIKQGKGVMPAIKLTPEETKAVIDYMTRVLK
jgi:mono/diheme cytochrome c family protein